MKPASSRGLPEDIAPDAPGLGQLGSRFLPVFVAVVAVMFGILAIGWGSHLADKWWNARLFAAEDDAIDAILARWERLTPANIDPDIWREVVVVVSNATGNVCFTYREVPVAEMRRLRAEIEAKDREPITVDTLAWLWRRLAQTGPHGNEYIVRMQPLWDEAQAAMAASQASANVLK